MNLFSLANISCAYGKLEVLHNLNLTLNSGKFYGLVGPNGSGKTTLLDTLLGNIKQTSGSVCFRSAELCSWDKRSLAKEVALVPQEFGFNFDFTVKEMVLMGRHPYIGRFSNPSEEDFEIVSNVMAELGISNLQSRYVTQLSGGEKQRVIVARALAQKTKVLILDEATSNLDIHHSIHIFKALSRRVTYEGCTVIAAIHDLNFASAYCDEVILLHDGQIVTVGTPNEVLSPQSLHDIFGVRTQSYFNEFSNAYQIAFQYQDNTAAGNDGKSITKGAVL